MGTEAFSAPGAFWRGNIHTHSNLSDGRLPPDEVCRRYRDAGYDFICLSDHFQEKYGFPIADTRPFRTNDFTTILGRDSCAGEQPRRGLAHPRRRIAGRFRADRC